MAWSETLLEALVFSAVMATMVLLRKKQDFSWIGLAIATAIFILVSEIFAVFR